MSRSVSHGSGLNINKNNKVSDKFDIQWQISDASPSDESRRNPSVVPTPRSDPYQPSRARPPHPPLMRSRQYSLSDSQLSPHTTSSSSDKLSVMKGKQKKSNKLLINTEFSPSDWNINNLNKYKKYRKLLNNNLDSCDSDED